MKDIIIGAATTLSVLGSFLLFGACLIVAAGKVVEERKKGTNA